MFKSIKRILPGMALSLALIVAPLSANAAAKPIAVNSTAVAMQFDGQELALPTGQIAFNYKDRFYIPVRFASYALQKTVTWDGPKSTVTVTEPSAAQAVSLKEILMNAAAAAKANGGKSTASGKKNVTPVDVKFVFDGKEKALPAGVQAFNLNGTIYVPVRFVSESVGVEVNWDPKTSTVSGQSKAYQEAQQQGNGNGSTGTGTGNESGGTGTEPGEVGGGGATAPKTVEEIQADTQKMLENMESDCINSIAGLLGKYEGDALIKQAKSKLASCESKFESAMKTTETKLKAAGASDDDAKAIIQGYRDVYEADLQKYREMAQQYLGIEV